MPQSWYIWPVLLLRCINHFSKFGFILFGGRICAWTITIVGQVFHNVVFVFFREDSAVFSVSRHQDIFPKSFCSWQPWTATLAWINVLCLQDWPAESGGFPEWLWRREQRSGVGGRTHTARQLTWYQVDSTVIDINATHAICTGESGVCACVRGAGEAGTHPTANSTPPRPSHSPVQPQIASMKVDTAAGRLTKTITASPVFLSCSTV